MQGVLFIDPTVDHLSAAIWYDIVLASSRYLSHLGSSHPKVMSWAIPVMRLDPIDVFYSEIECIHTCVSSGMSAFSFDYAVYDDKAFFSDGDVHLSRFSDDG